METINPYIKRVVVLGPESTGKSTLCRELALAYQTRWVPEYAREYLEASGPGYAEADLWRIAEGQIRLEREALQAMRDVVYPLPLFIDTNLYVIKVWSEYVFQACDNRILNHLAMPQSDLYLLCDTDLPWEADPLRELPDPNERKRIFHYYLDAMLHQPVPWALVHGPAEERLVKAMEAVDRLLV